MLFVLTKFGFAQVIIYSDCNYNDGLRGHTKTLGVGDYKILPTLSGYDFNHNISSIQVNNGFMVTVYEHINFKGKSLVFKSEEPCLVNKNFNDIISSMKVERTDDNASNITNEMIHAGQAFTTLCDESAYVRKYAGKIIQKTPHDIAGIRAVSYDSPDFGRGYEATSARNGATYCNSLKQGVDNRTAVWGPIMVKWNNYSGMDDELGWPTQGNTPTKNNGEFAFFQNGAIYLAPLSIDAHIVKGAIREGFVKTGSEYSAIGFPISDEKPLPNNTGVYQVYEKGLIYFKWKPLLNALPAEANKAHTVRGAILDLYAKEGYEKGKYGFPVEDEGISNDGKYYVQKFEKDIIQIKR